MKKVIIYTLNGSNLDMEIDTPSLSMLLEDYKSETNIVEIKVEGEVKYYITREHITLIRVEE